MELGRMCSSQICLNLPVYGGNWDPLDRHSSSLWLSGPASLLCVMLSLWQCFKCVMLWSEGGEPPVQLLATPRAAAPTFPLEGMRGEGATPL